MTRFRLSIFLLATVSAGPLAAQDDGVNPNKERIRREILEMRRKLREGKLVRTNVRVKVNLQNGNKIVGVVRNGRFVEKIQSLDFVPADMRTPGAGIRVWYYDNTTSYIFLPFEAIRSYKIGARLTDVQVKEIEQRIKAEAEAARRRREQELARRRALAEQEAGEEGGEKDLSPEERERLAKEEEEKKKEEERLLALVAEYPPEAGWGEEKVRQIQMRKITVGAFPDARSRRFLEVFEDWKKGLKLRQEREKEEAGRRETEGSGKEPGPALPPGSRGK